MASNSITSTYLQWTGASRERSQTSRITLAVSLPVKSLGVFFLFDCLFLFVCFFFFYFLFFFCFFFFFGGGGGGGGVPGVESQCDRNWY